MNREVLRPEGLWDSTKYHFSHAVRIRDFKDLLLISGQTGITNDLKVVQGIDEQIKLSLNYIKRIIEQSGGKMDNIVKLNVYFRDVGHLPRFEQALSEHFPDGGYPAQTVVEVKALALPELLIEVEAMVAL
jgi:2-iminobutanoate/2-iminopropanoate deaminase